MTFFKRVTNFHKDRPENVGSVGKGARSLILWTERSAARHAKMLETDRAWDVLKTDT